MQSPRKETLVEAIYRDIEKDEYLKEIYNSLLYNYSLNLFHIDEVPLDVDINSALRFADLLAKSMYEPRAEFHKLWGQEIAILLSVVYPKNKKVQYYLGEVLSTLGNYRGLISHSKDGFESVNLLDNIYYEYDKETHLIPNKDNEYFFHDQKEIYDNLENKYFSYSGPTSLGKSFVAQTYIEEQIRNGSTNNYAILVPTKVLINEVRGNIINELKNELRNNDYVVVTSSGDYLLKRKHHFVFVMTPERFLHLIITMPDIKIDFLFIDEAHRISERGGRSAYYYKVAEQIAYSNNNTKIIFASPNIPNPEVYFKIIPNYRNIKVNKLTSRYSPVCQFKYYIDLVENDYCVYSEHTKSRIPINLKNNEEFKLKDIINLVGEKSQNLVYCSSKNKVLDLAVEYASGLDVIDDEKLIALSNDVKKEVHEKCFLADLILKGVAYHVGYLPANIRLRIEKSFEEGVLKTIFCTSTLIEGVNLPADNLFIMSYKNSTSNMNEVEFKNLIGRVGRIKYNLFGNVFLVRDNKALSNENYLNLLSKDVPEQNISIENKKNKRALKYVIDDLKQGDLELSQLKKKGVTGKEYEALRNFSLILTRDIALGKDTPIKEAFVSAGVLNQKTEAIIKEKFPEIKTNDDITLSYDQFTNLTKAIANGLSYPQISEDDEVDFEEVVSFMMKLRKIFKWEIYERNTLGRKGKTDDGVLRWYSLLLLRWIKGNGLNRIIHYTLDYKARNPETGVWVGSNKLFDYYEKNNKFHQNYIIAETLSDIENVLLYRIANYFRKFSIEYKKYHNIEIYKNDWYDFVEYGSTNEITMFLQQTGFTRQSAEFIKANQKKYLSVVDGELRINRSILNCGNIDVEIDANDIQYNAPELFI